MAITLASLGTDRYGFVANGYSANWSGCESLKAAVTGKSHYIESVTINCASAITITVGAGETGGAVTAVLLGPFTFTASGCHYHCVFPRPIKVDAATAIVADSSGAGAACIVVTGFTQ